MKKITFGTPEEIKPSIFCKNFSYQESDVTYPLDKISFEVNARGCLVRLPLDEGEQIYGLGLQLRAFNLRGRKLVARPNADPVAPTGDSHAPVPFFVSTKGYGVYLDTARYAEFYFGSSAPLKKRNTTSKTKMGDAISEDELYAITDSGKSHTAIQIPVAKGIDLYIIEGKNITDIVAQYNMLAGGGCDVPEWGLSAIYRTYKLNSQDDVVEIAKKMKDQGLSFSTIGLEANWLSHSYSSSYLWNPEYNPQKLADDLKEMGYHLNLWEQMFVHPSSPIYDDLFEYSGDYEVWEGCVPDFSIPEARKIFADYHKKLVQLGVDGFKLDECDSSDYTGSWSFPNHAKFPGGMDGEQYHSLLGTLYMQTILEALDGTQTLSEVRNAGALAASYPFVLYSDLFEHKVFIRGCATSGFSGLLWKPEVRYYPFVTKEDFIRRFQTTVFSVQCMVNLWNCKVVPWDMWECSDEVKYWLDVRESLIPMLKEAFHKYHETGIPPVRALVSDYTDDPETYRIDDQYIFCEDMIVAPVVVGENSRKVYLPEGKWEDYFTGKSVDSGWFEVETDRILVYKKVIARQ